MANDDKLLRQLKMREIESYQWQKEVIGPLSEEFQVSIDEINDLFVNNLDMSNINNLHATFQSANHEEILLKLYSDLHLKWFIEVLEMITVKQGDKIRVPLFKRIVEGEDYDKVLQEGRNQLFAILNKNNID